MTHEEAAQILDLETREQALSEYNRYERLSKLEEACRIAAEVLRNRKAGEAITLEQLLEMDGQPVYCGDQKEWGVIHIDPDGPWANVPFFRGVYCDLDVQRNGLSLYAYPPAHTDLLARAEAAEAQAEKAEMERDAAIHDVFEAASAKCFWCKHQDHKWLSDGKMDDLCFTCLKNNKCNWEWNGGQKEE